MTLRLSALGRVRCYQDGRELTDLPNQRLRCALLLYLAVEREGSRDQVQNLFWSDRTDRKSRGALKQAVLDLRRLLGKDCIQTIGNRLVIGDHVTTDVGDLISAEAVSDWPNVMALYQGAFLQDFSVANCNPFEHWSDLLRTRLARIHRLARRMSIRDRVQFRDVRGALSIAQPWALLDPLDTEAHYWHIKLLASCGEQAEAVQQCDSYERFMRAEELDILPQMATLIADVRAGRLATPFDDFDSSPVQQPPDPIKRLEPVQQSWSRRRKKVIAISIPVTVLAFVWGLSLAWSRWPIRSLAVLYCDNVSPVNEESRYIADYYIEELTGALSPIRGLRVPGHTSAGYFRGKQALPGEIGARLNVAGILESTCVIDDQQIRINVQLIRARTGYVVWRSDSFVSDRRDPYAMLDKIVREIIKQLAIELRAQDEVRLAARPTRKMEALDLYAHGRAFWNKRTRSGLARAITYFDSASRVDPNFALAYSGLSDAHLVSMALGFQSFTQGCTEARRAALRSLALDSTLAVVHVTVARYRMDCESDSERALEEYRRAIDIDRWLPVAHSWYGWTLSNVLRRYDEGIRESRIARRLDPLSTAVFGDAGRIFRAAQMNDSAIAMFQFARELEPEGGDPFGLARAYFQKGMWPQAAALLDTLIDMKRNLRMALAFRALTHERMGERDRFEALVTQIEEMGRSGSVWDAIAFVRMGVNDREGAIAALEHASKSRTQGFSFYIGSEPMFEPLLDDPRFVALAKQAGVSTTTTKSRGLLGKALSGLSALTGMPHGSWRHYAHGPARD